METLFLQNADFCWDTDKLGTVTTIRMFSAFGVSMVAMVIFRRLETRDVVIAAISIVLSIASRIVFAFSTVVRV